VGVTTLAVNLALTLNNEDTRVVIVDANLQFGDVAVFVNEQGKNSIADLAPRADELDPEIVEEVLLTHPATGLRILAAPTRPEAAERITSGQFSKIIDYLRQMYAYIVIDAASMLTDVTLASMDASDIVVLVTTQDIPSIKNTRLFMDLLQTLGIGRERIVFTVNKYDKRISITPERIGENLKQKVATVIPLDERTVIPAVNRGIPFVIDNNTQPVARAVFGLAESVRACLTNLENEEVENVSSR
jgi:pilus assembly protein CpaE